MRTDRVPLPSRKRPTAMRALEGVLAALCAGVSTRPKKPKFQFRLSALVFWTPLCFVLSKLLTLDRNRRGRNLVLVVEVSPATSRRCHGRWLPICPATCDEKI